MCYSDWARKTAELKALEKAKREAEELTKRARQPQPAGGAAAPRTPEKPAVEKPEPAAV